MFKKILFALKFLKSHIEGDFAYKNYVSHLKEKHSEQIPLCRKEFYRKKQQEKWNKVNRCC